MYTHPFSHVGREKFQFVAERNHIEFKKSTCLSNRRKILAVTSQLKQLQKESLKKFRLERVRTHECPLRCRCSALPIQLSYQANWELVIL